MSAGQHDLKIIRGDTLDLVVGLAQGWTHVDSNPAAYQGRLVFRQEQNDAMPELLVITASPEPSTDENFPDLLHILDLSMTPAQTAALPTYPIVCFCELRMLDGSFVRRLFSGNVIVED